MVQIMSIHKSKGLEFPICFVAGTGKLFNKQDVRGKLMIDSDLGIGTDYLDLEQRTKTVTLKKNVMKRKMDLDNLGEELRVLYVAMTRAKEKLILTGTDRSLAKKMERWCQRGGRDDSLARGPLPITILTSAGSYLDWILMTNPLKTGLFQVEEIPVKSLVTGEILKQIEKRISKKDLLSLNLEQTFDEKMERQLQEGLNFRYPFMADIDLHTKMTVSEIKRLSQEMDDFDGLCQPQVLEFPDDDTPEAKTTKEEDKKRKAVELAAERGTAYHRILELLDFSACSKREGVEEEIRRLCSCGKISQEKVKLVKPEVIWKFVSSPLGRRIAASQANRQCYKERQFVIGIEASKMGAGDSEELVLVQGIIDVYLEEADGLVLIDYKTDHVRKGQEELLRKRYKAQMDYYQKALEQMTGKTVKERIIYSLALQEEIRV